MARKKRNGVRPRVHYPLLSEIPPSQLIRANPSTDKLSTRKRHDLETLTQDYIGFVDSVRIAPDVINELLKRSRNYEFNKNRRNLTMVHEEGSAVSFVRLGKRPLTEGMTIMYAHADSPALQVKVNPILFEWDPEDRDLHTGVELSVIPYGGLGAHNWEGKSYILRGKTIIEGRPKDIRLNVYSPDASLHSDNREVRQTEFSEAHTHEGIRLATGYPTIKSLLKVLGLKGPEDFARSQIFAVPKTKAERIGPHLIASYGHDDRSCAYALTNAFFNCDPEYTAMCLIFDKEEVGSDGDGGSNSQFFEKVFEKVVRESKLESELTRSERIQIIERSLAINADVDVAASHRELDNVDKKGVIKLGYGVYVNATSGIWGSDQTPIRAIDYVMTALTKKGVVFQPVGPPLPADEAGDVPTWNDTMVKRGYKVVNLGIGVAGLHRNEELIHSGDLLAARDAYQAIYNFGPNIRKKFN